MKLSSIGLVVIYFVCKKNKYLAILLFSFKDPVEVWHHYLWNPFHLVNSTRTNLLIVSGWKQSNHGRSHCHCQFIKKWDHNMDKLIVEELPLMNETGMRGNWLVKLTTLISTDMCKPCFSLFLSVHSSINFSKMGFRTLCYKLTILPGCLAVLKFLIVLYTINPACLPSFTTISVSKFEEFVC